MKWVRIEGGSVYEVIPEEATVPDIATWYGEDFAAQCVEAPDEVQQNWRYDAETGIFSEPGQYEPPEDPPPVETGAYTQEEMNAFLEGLMGGAGIEPNR